MTSPSVVISADRQNPNCVGASLIPFFVCACACVSAVVAIESKSKATGVSNMKKYQEAKAAMANTEATTSSPSRKPPPPQVDLYK